MNMNKFISRNVHEMSEVFMYLESLSVFRALQVHIQLHLFSSEQEQKSIAGLVPCSVT